MKILGVWPLKYDTSMSVVMVEFNEEKVETFRNWLTSKGYLFLCETKTVTTFRCKHAEVTEFALSW